MLRETRHTSLRPRPQRLLVRHLPLFLRPGSVPDAQGTPLTAVDDDASPSHRASPVHAPHGASIFGRSSSPGNPRVTRRRASASFCCLPSAIPGCSRIPCDDSSITPSASTCRRIWLMRSRIRHASSRTACSCSSSSNASAHAFHSFKLAGPMSSGMPKLSTPKKKPVRALSVAEVRTLRRGIHEWQADENEPAGRSRCLDLLDVAVVMLVTGLRIGEVLALRWSDIDLGGHPKLTVWGTLVRTNEVGLFRHPRTKTLSGYRTQTLPRFVAEVLLRRSAD